MTNCTPDSAYKALDRGVPPTRDLSGKTSQIMPTAAHLDNARGGPTEMALLAARISTLQVHGEEAMSAHDLRNGFSVKGTIRLLTNQLEQMRKMTDPSAHPPDTTSENKRRGGDPLTEEQPPGGGLEETLELLVEIRMARSLLLSYVTEMKKRCKVKVVKLNIAESKLLDAYEEHDPQMTLFDLPPITDDLRDILNNPTN